MGRVAARLADYASSSPTKTPVWRAGRPSWRRSPSRGQGGGRCRGGASYASRTGGRPSTPGLAEARPGDTVLLAGKGHERSIIGARGGRLHAYPWDEREAARDALRRLGYG